MKPLVIHGRGKSVTFPVPLFLAPMEGITEACFRDLVIGLGAVGGACTEFIRISNSPAPTRVIRRNLGMAKQRCPVGVQLMAPDTAHLTASVVNAERAGADFIDLNFGCPAPVVFDKCAGSALLCSPGKIAEIATTACAATVLPVSVKIRAGIDGPGHLDELVTALVPTGIAMLTLHARLRVHSYAQPARWEWIAQVAALLRKLGKKFPLIGNGSVERADDVASMVAQTGCDGIMIGRAALADPWIFNQALGGSVAHAEQAADFAIAYGQRLSETYGERTALARLKQLVKYYRAGDLFIGREESRRELLRANGLPELLAWFRESRSRSRPESWSEPASVVP